MILTHFHSCLYEALLINWCTILKTHIGALDYNVITENELCSVHVSQIDCSLQSVNFKEPLTDPNWFALRLSALVDRWWNIDAPISDSSATGWTGTFGTWELFLQRPSAMENFPLVSFQTQICSNLCLSLNQRLGNAIYNLNAALLLCKDWLITYDLI